MTKFLVTLVAFALTLVAYAGTVNDSRTGNSASVAGATTTDHCVKFNASGNLADAGAACGTGSGSVTSVATTGPITGGTITTTGTIACATCATTTNGGALSATAPATISAAGVIANGLASVTNDAQTKAAVVPNTAPSGGQILAGNAGGTAYAPVTLSGSGTTATLSSAGVLTLSAIPAATISTSTSGANIGLLNGANTYSGASTFSSTLTNSVAGAASAPGLTVSGVPFAGTGTTSFPQLYVNENTATASTTMNTAGTGLGVNIHGTPDIFNGMLDGVSKFVVSSGGNVTPAGTLNMASASAITYNADTSMCRSSSGVVGVNNSSSCGTGGGLSTGTVTAGTTLKLSGNIIASATAPSIASGFGTSPSVVNNAGTAAFTINVGTGGTATNGVVTMPTSSHGWACSVTPNAAPQAAAEMFSAPTSTTSITITNYTASTGVALAWPASAVLQVICIGY